MEKMKHLTLFHSLLQGRRRLKGPKKYSHHDSQINHCYYLRLIYSHSSRALLSLLLTFIVMVIYGPFFSLILPKEKLPSLFFLGGGQ